MKELVLHTIAAIYAIAWAVGVYLLIDFCMETSEKLDNIQRKVYQYTDYRKFLPLRYRRKSRSRIKTTRP